MTVKAIEVCLLTAVRRVYGRIIIGSVRVNINNFVGDEHRVVGNFVVCVNQMFSMG